MKKRFIILWSLVLVFFATSCSLDPTLAQDEDIEFLPTTESLRQLIDGSYVRMVNYRYMGRNMIIAGEVRADNVYSDGNSGRFIRWSNMNLLDTDGDAGDLMAYAYGTATNANILINTNMDDVEGSDADKNQILGEAYALRAYAYFDLLRVFGQKYSEGNNLGISYVKQFKGPRNIPRGTVDSNYEDLKSDIENAIHYMSLGQDSEYADSKTNFNLDAVYALQSRVGIYMKDYTYAYNGSKEIVDAYPVTPEGQFVQMWKQQTPPPASIFELFQNTSTNNQGINGIANIYRGTSYGDIMVFDNFIDDADFDSGDIRISEDMIKVADGGLRNMGKYPSMGTMLGADNIKVFRIEEIVLNHAEALANGAGTGDPLEYLNRIPENRGASAYSEASMENILKERRKELVFEGFRFFDLARMGMDIRDMGEPINNHGHIEAGNYKFAFPIPQREMNQNRDAVQNPGY